MKRGPKPKPEGERAIDRRVNITIDVSVQNLLSDFQCKLEEKFGFKPTLNQTITYMIKNNTEL